MNTDKLNENQSTEAPTPFLRVGAVSGCHINLDGIIPDFEKSLNDTNTFCHHWINYSFLTKWQKIVRRFGCKISGHTIIKRTYQNPYCSNCMREFLAVKNGCR